MRALSLSRRAARRRWARVSSASRHSTRNRSSLTGPVSTTRTARHSPPGFQARSTASECWNSPVMLRRPRVPPLGVAGHLDGEHVVVAEAAQRRDVEAVGEEVALRVAEVGAVQPDVGLVEDAVERHPAPCPGRRRRQVEAGAVQDRTVARGQVGVRRASDRAPSRRASPLSSTSRPIPARRSSSSAALARHAPDSSTAPQASHGADGGTGGRHFAMSRPDGGRLASRVVHLP